jgi:peptidoglycan/xylan/chitin deacetylase (PgdA/CDA1 family)
MNRHYRRKRRKNRSFPILPIVIGILVVVLVAGGGIWARNTYIKSKETKAKMEATAAKEEIKTNVWEKKDGKSYYYGDDGQIVTGRFVLEDEKKIYYTDDQGAVTRTVDGTKPMISITYDDGPSQYSADFAALFDEYNSAATFFEVCERIEEMPSLEKQEQAIADSNSELASHTYSHKNLTKLSKKEMKKQLDKNDEVLKSYGETADPILFRAPEGAVNSTVRENCGKPILLWSLDTLDWKNRDANKVYKKAIKATDGEIILMHSLYESSLEASKKLVPELIDKGYQLVSLTDLAQFRGGLENGEKYFSFRPTEDTTTEAASTETTTEEATTTAEE